MTIRDSSYDTLIVGAGFAGSVMAERLATECDQRVLVIDRRPHIAGNAYDYADEHGVLRAPRSFGRHDTGTAGGIYCRDFR